MLIALCISIISVAAIIFYSRRLFRYLAHLQEVQYNRKQFKNWLVANGVYDRKGSAIATVAALAIELTKEKIIISLIISLVGAIALIWLGFWEPDPRKIGVPSETGEFRLQATERATKLYNLALSIYSIVLILVILGAYALGADDDMAVYWLIVIFSIQSSPVWLLIASTLAKSKNRTF
jgi:UDP-N-acetylmuramoyl-tripeptide--D-alanyl-D-alanine ligase